MSPLSQRRSSQLYERSIRVERLTSSFCRRGTSSTRSVTRPTTAGSWSTTSLWWGWTSPWTPVCTVLSVSLPRPQPTTPARPAGCWAGAGPWSPDPRPRSSRSWSWRWWMTKLATTRWTETPTLPSSSVLAGRPARTAVKETVEVHLFTRLEVSSSWPAWPAGALGAPGPVCSVSTQRYRVSQ